MSTKSNDLAIVPVVLMIAVSPSMLNAKTPVHIMPMGEDNIPELIAQPTEEVNDATYVAKPEEFQQDYPLGVAFFDRLKVLQIKPAVGNGVKANLVLTSYKPDKGDVAAQVFFVEHSFKSNNKLVEPPLVQELIYHNLGPDKEYLGILIKEKIYRGETYPILTKVAYVEVKLDDESAQFLLDLQAGVTKWKDCTGINFSETTNSKVRRPRVIEY